MADQLWANSRLRPSEFSTPVLGLIFPRDAENRFAEAEARIGPASTVGAAGENLHGGPQGSARPTGAAKAEASRRMTRMRQKCNARLIFSGVSRKIKTFLGNWT